ncbi:hypothetical protein DDI74_19075 [Chryseobacterium gleum]|nr:hypothetical protein DDI74_17135 [Chryseobacterium gleum]QBJ88215.1 hypothetical protein DDI74_19075 [Chryseobacterium gleum]
MRSYYLCPTENESRSVSAEELLAKQEHYLLHKRQTKKTLKLFAKKSCEIKKSLYLCSPNKSERRSRGIEGLRRIKVT